jgi:hypothetical protein
MMNAQMARRAPICLSVFLLCISGCDPGVQIYVRNLSKRPLFAKVKDMTTPFYEVKPGETMHVAGSIQGEFTVLYKWEVGGEAKTFYLSDSGIGSVTVDISEESAVAR